MKKTNFKLFTMFLAGIAFSALTVFAATISISTNFEDGAIQYLNKLVVTDNNNITGVLLDGTNKQIWVKEICDEDGDDCKFVEDLGPGYGSAPDMSEYFEGVDGKWCVMSNDKIMCNQEAPTGGGGGGEIGDYSINSIKIATGAITNPKITDSAVTSGKIDDSAVIENKIANYAITTNKIKTGNVTQDQVSNGYVDLSSNQTISGRKTFSESLNLNSDISFSDAASYTIKVNPPRSQSNQTTSGRDLNLFAGNSSNLFAAVKGGALNLHGGDAGGSGGYIKIEGGNLMDLLGGGYDKLGGSVTINGGGGAHGTGSVILADNGGTVKIGQSTYNYNHHALNINGHMTIGGTNAFSIIFFTNMLGGGSASTYTQIYSTGNLVLSAGEQNNRGKVGINKDNPQATLDVNGAIRFSNDNTNDNTVVCNSGNVGMLSYLNTDNGSELKICMKTSSNAYSGVTIASYSQGILSGGLYVGEGQVVVNPGMDP